MPFAREHCRRCRGYGLIRLRYRSGEQPDDIAYCHCSAGLWYQRAGPLMVRRLCPGIHDQAQIATLAAFDALQPIHGEVFTGG